MSDSTTFQGGTAESIAIRDNYLALVRRKQMYSGILMVVFIAMMVSGFHLADSRNAGGFWDGLPQEVRDVFETQASILEDETPDTYRTLNDQEHARMAEAGMTRLTLSDSVAAKLDDAVVEGAWAFAETRDGETAVRLRAAVEAAGLLE